MTATPAPALTAAELSRVQAFDAAPYPVEVREAALVETVVLPAVREAAHRLTYSGDPDPWPSDDDLRTLAVAAAAAIAAYRAAQDGAAEEAVRRVDWLYNEASGALYGPSSNPHLRQVVAAEVEPGIGHLIANTMNRVALATQAGDER